MLRPLNHYSRYVFSFMSKEDCQKALAQQGLGTFLIRFSESNPGMLAIAYVCEDESERILNCLIKNEDIGSNKSLPEFLRFVTVHSYLFFSSALRYFGEQRKGPIPIYYENA